MEKSLHCSEFTASLVSIGPIAWLRLDNDQVRFTIIPEQGTQVWAFVATLIDPRPSIWSLTYIKGSVDCGSHES